MSKIYNAFNKLRSLVKAKRTIEDLEYKIGVLEGRLTAQLAYIDSAHRQIDKLREELHRDDSGMLEK